MGQYKTDTTSYVFKDIPVPVWKKIKKVLVNEDIPSANALLLFLVDEYIQGRTERFNGNSE